MMVDWYDKWNWEDSVFPKREIDNETIFECYSDEIETDEEDE